MEDLTRVIDGENQVFINNIEVCESLLLQGVCAGRNTNGCKIYFGWTLNNKEPYFEGVNDLDSIRRKIERLLQTDDRFSYRHDLYRNYEVHQEGKRVGLIVKIEEAPIDARPVTVNGLAYIFLGGKIETLSPSLQETCRQCAHPYEADLSPLPAFTAQDLDEDSIADFRQSSFASRKQSKTLSTHEFLQQIRALTSSGEVTFAGLLFFGKQSAREAYAPGLSFTLYETKGDECRLLLPEKGCFSGLYSFCSFIESRLEAAHGNAWKLRFHRDFLYAIDHCDFSSPDPIVVYLTENGYRLDVGGCPLLSPSSPYVPSLHPILRNLLQLMGGFAEESLLPVLGVSLSAKRWKIETKCKETPKAKPSKEPSTKKKGKREDLSFAKEIEGLFRDELCLAIASFRASQKEEVFGRGEFLSATGVSPATGTSCLKKLLQAKKIRPVKGQGKGKFRFR